jgi:hypothetical protein
LWSADVMTKREFKELGFARAVELADGLPTIAA